MTTFVSLMFDPLVLGAVWATIWTAIVAQLLGVLFGLPLAIAQRSDNVVLRITASFYNWIFQGTPLLVQLVFLWAILPLIGVRLDVVMAGLVGLALYESARMSQILRAAIGGIDWRQHETARNLGMSALQVLILVTGPQALRIAIPPTGNEFNFLFKATSLLAAIGIVELTRQTMVFTDRDLSNPLPYFAVAAVYYLAMSTAWQAIQDRVESRIARQGFADRIDVRIQDAI